MYKRRSSAWLAIFGLFFQSLVAGIHIPPALAVVGLQLSAPSDDQTFSGAPFRTIVICTLNGLQTITLDESGQPVGKNPSPGNGNLCSICLSLSNTSLSADFDFASLKRAFPARVSPALRQDRLENFPLRTSKARGPPVV